MKRLLSLLLTIAMVLTMIPAVVFAEPNNIKEAGTTETAQAAIDAAVEGDSIVLAAGNYGTLYLRNNSDQAGRTIKNVTIKSATNSAVNVEQITYQQTYNKWLNIENFTIDGLIFNEPTKTAVFFDYSSANLLRIDGLTIKNCTKVGDGKQDGSGYEYHAFLGCYTGGGHTNTQFAGDNNLKAGYNNIVIDNNKITNIIIPIRFANNDVKNGLTVTNNYFKDCTDNLVQLSGSNNTGDYIFSNNTIENINGRVARLAGVAADSKIEFKNNILKNANSYDTGGDGTIAKVSGAAGFEVIDDNNDWVIGDFTSNEETTWQALGPVAEIEGIKYSALSDAISNAKDNDTIKLLSNIVLTENAGVTIPDNLTVTLDLNGKNLSNKLTVDGASQVIMNKGNLTIQDTSNGANGSISTLASPDSIGNWNTTPKRNWATVAINNEGTLTLKSGKIVSTAESGIAYAIDNGKAATLNIDGGTVETMGKVEAIRMIIYSSTDTCTVNITDGKVTGSGAVWMQADGANVKGVLNVTGGTLNTKTGYRIVGFEADDANTTLNNVKVNVSGGKFSKDSSATNNGYPFETENYNGASATFDYNYIELTGGLFHMRSYKDQINNKVEDLNTLCAENYVCAPNTDRTTRDEYPYQIIPKTDFVEVDDGEIKVGENTIEVELGTGSGSLTLDQLNTVASTVQEAVNNHAVSDINAKADIDDEDAKKAIVNKCGIEEGSIDKIEDQTVKVELKGIEVTVDENLLITEMKFDVTPSVSTTIITDGTSTTYTAEIEGEVGQPIKFRLPIDNNVTQHKYVEAFHYNEEEKPESLGFYAIKAKNDEKYIEILGKEFSIYGYQLQEVSFESAAQIGDSYYETLAAAINAVETGDTIVLLKDTEDDAITINKAVSFTIDKSGKTIKCEITVGSEYKLSPSGTSKIVYVVEKDNGGSDDPGIDKNALLLAALGGAAVGAGVVGTGALIAGAMQDSTKPVDPVKPEEPQYTGCPRDYTCLLREFVDLDVNGWYHDGIEYILKSGLMKGVGNDKFDPNGKTTRPMMMTILARMDGCDTEGGETWDAIGKAWAKTYGISDGIADSGNITREEFATMLYRYAKMQGEGFTGSWMFLLDFKDAGNISSFANEAMHWCVMKGILNGRTGQMEGMLDPQGELTRAEAAAMIQRFMEREK